MVEVSLSEERMMRELMVICLTDGEESRPDNGLELDSNVKYDQKKKKEPPKESKTVSGSKVPTFK